MSKKILIFLVVNLLILSIFFSSYSIAGAIIYDSSEDNSDLDLRIHTDSVLLVEKQSGDILYEKNGYNKMYPASTTKILTAIIVLEKCYLNDLVTISSNAVNSVPPSYTTARLKAGEQLSVLDLLYAMLLPSGNDAANALAEHVSGSINSFSELMNEKAVKLGLTNSHFTNPSGMEDENLYTTAYDLSIIARYAMDIEKFREIVQTTSYTLPSTAIYPESDRTFRNSNLLLDSNNTNYYYEYANGIKTGFTDSAGDCLVASAKKDDVEFIAVCLHSGNLENGLREKFLDCQTLFDFAFSNYTTRYTNLQEKNEENITSTNNEIDTNVELNNGTFKDNQNSDFLRILAKIVCAIIILIVIKLMFFRKKKNRRRRFKKKH